ncbi:MAG: hypothetical protein L6Q71_07910, partial [Planctomycetes bacterium]|nr:hypothetical protein [Planctomycetota bacterium]
MEEYFEQIRRKLAGLRSSLRWMFVAHGMARVLLALALLLLWHYGTDVLLHLSLPLRAGALLIMAGVVGFILVRKIAYPLSRRISEEELALLVENEYPLLNDRLITALQLYRDRDRYRDVASQAMVDSVILEGFEVANRLRFRDVVQSGRLLMMTGVAVAAVLMLGVVLFADQAQAQRWARRLLLENVEYERDVKLDIQFPSDLERFPTSDALILNHTYDMDARKVRVARGAGLRIVAIPKSGDSESATIRFEPEEGEAHEEKMNVEYEESGEERKVAYYHYNIPAVLGDQDIFIEAGDANDGPFFVEAAHAPALAKDTRIIYNYPSYMGREEEIQTGTRNIAAPEKTKVRIEFQTERNEALAEHGAFVTFYVTGADPQKVEATPLDATHSRFSVEYQLDASTTEYEFTLLGNDGLRNTERLRYTIRAEIDRPPEVSFTFHGKGLEDESRVPVTPGGILPLRFTVKDRYGVKKRDLLYRAFLPDSTEKDPEWKPLAAFSAAYERRDGALTT